MNTTVIHKNLSKAPNFYQSEVNSSVPVNLLFGSISAC